MQEDEEGEVLVRDQGEHRQQGGGDQRPEQGRHLRPGEEQEQQAVLRSFCVNLFRHHIKAKTLTYNKSGNNNQKNNKKNIQDDVQG